MRTLALQNLPWGASVGRVLEAAIQAVDPHQAVSRWMSRDSSILTVKEKKYPLELYKHIYVIAVGKAAMPMGLAAMEILGPYFSEGIILTKEGHTLSPGKRVLKPGLQIFEAGHPLPDIRGVDAANKIIKCLSTTGKDDLVLFLISGGGSALMISPPMGITLDDLQGLTAVLLSCGATINEMNTLRKHLDTLKGGGIARLAAPATLITLVLSDVVGDPLDMIASGPSVPDTTTFKDAYSVLEKYKILDKISQSILNRLHSGLRGDVPETPKPGEELFYQAQYIVVGSNRLAAEAAAKQAKKEGFGALLLTTTLEGEARQAGRIAGAIAREIVATGNPVPRPACVIMGGETTVTIQGNGVGGRNQEFALGAVDNISGLDNIALVTLATDGGDGPTDAAGAVVTGETKTRAEHIGLSPSDHLSRNDSYHFFESLDDLLKTGPTQTNVNDLAFIFAG